MISVVVIVLHQLELIKLQPWHKANVISNVGTWFATVTASKKQFADQVRISLISQFINGISSVLQKLLRYFNGTIISVSFLLFFPVPPATFSLNLNEILLFIAGESTMLLLLSKPGSSL